MIDGFEDFTIGGKRVTLVFWRDHAPLQTQAELLENVGNVEVKNCVRTEVENFNMDWNWENDPRITFDRDLLPQKGMLFALADKLLRVQNLEDRKDRSLHMGEGSGTITPMTCQTRELRGLSAARLVCRV